MTTETPPLSIPELERLLDSKKTSLLDLAKRREELVAQIDEIDQEIQQLADLRGIAGRSRPRKRVANTTSLRSVILELLQKNKKGFKLADLAAKVTETGYRSHSRNFTNVVYQSLYNTPEIEHDATTGCYRLKK